MQKFIFLDTETTGIDPLVDRIVQVAYKYDGEIYSSYFKPPVPISVKSMSISHITNNEIADKEEFSTSVFRRVLQERLVNGILIAHNAIFDIDMLAKEGVSVDTFIDTYKLIRFFDPENEIPEYGLQYLRYYLDFNVDAKAHDAIGDVIVLEKLFDHIYNKAVKTYGSEMSAVEKMIEVSGKPLLITKFSYGKHKGKIIEEVLSYDRSYLEWMLEQKLNGIQLDEDWIFTLKHHLQIND